MNRQRISAKDYKRGSGRRHGQLDIRYPQFLAGLGVGLLVALGVYFHDHRAKPDDEAVAAAEHPATKVAADAPHAEEDNTEQYDFYDMLPKFEVLIPETDRNVQRSVPSVPIEQPGAYVIQAGSFQKEAEATRQVQKLSKLGIDAIVQRIAIDADVKHRVRIGPTRDLKRLNEMRRQLGAADIDALVIKLPE